MSYFSTRALRWAAPVALVGAIGLAACGNSDIEDVRTAAPSAAGAGSDQHLNNKAEELAQQEAAYRAASVGSDQHLANKAAELATRSASAGSDEHLNNLNEQIARRAAVAGSDQHLNNKAAEIARQRADQAASDRLTGQAEQIADRSASARFTGLAEQMAQVQAERRAALARRAEWSAHLEGQAETYGRAVPTNSDVKLPDAWEAGSRAIELERTEQQYRASQMAQANAYVDSLEARAGSTTNRSAMKAQADAYVDSLESRAAEGSSTYTVNGDEFLPGSHHVPVR